MGGIYLYQWTCNKCEFEDETISSPFRVEAKSGVYKSLISYRFHLNFNLYLYINYTKD